MTRRIAQIALSLVSFWLGGLLFAFVYGEFSTCSDTVVISAKCALPQPWPWVSGFVLAILTFFVIEKFGRPRQRDSMS